MLCIAVNWRFIWEPLDSCSADWRIATAVTATTAILLAVVWSWGVRLWQLPQSDRRRGMHAFWLLPLSVALLIVTSCVLVSQWAQHCAAPPNFLWAILQAVLLTSIPGTLLCCAANLPAPPCRAMPAGLPNNLTRVALPCMQHWCIWLLSAARRRTGHCLLALRQRWAHLPPGCFWCCITAPSPARPCCAAWRL